MALFKFIVLNDLHERFPVYLWPLGEQWCEDLFRALKAMGNDRAFDIVTMLERIRAYFTTKLNGALGASTSASSIKLDSVNRGGFLPSAALSFLPKSTSSADIDACVNRGIVKGFELLLPFIGGKRPVVVARSSGAVSDTATTLTAPSNTNVSVSVASPSSSSAAVGVSDAHDDDDESSDEDDDDAEPELNASASNVCSVDEKFIHATKARLITCDVCGKKSCASHHGLTAKMVKHVATKGASWTCATCRRPVDKEADDDSTDDDDDDDDDAHGGDLPAVRESVATVSPHNDRVKLFTDTLDLVKRAVRPFNDRSSAPIAPHSIDINSHFCRYPVAAKPPAKSALPRSTKVAIPILATVGTTRSKTRTKSIKHTHIETVLSRLSNPAYVDPNRLNRVKKAVTKTKKAKK